MLLPHPKYKGSFIALPAPSFSSKLIASETWMTLESEAPLTPLLGFSEERFPSPDTVPALSQRGGRGAGLCRARCGCAAQFSASLAPGHVGPLLPALWGQQHADTAPKYQGSSPGAQAHP